MQKSYLEQRIDHSITKALDQLVKRTAREIVELNNPLLLGIFYDGDTSQDGVPHGDSLAIPMYSLAIRNKPAQAADAYAWWAHSIMKSTNDSVQAMAKLRRALEIDPNNAPSHRFLANIKIRNGDFEGGEKLLIKSLALDSTSAIAWYNLGERYVKKNWAKDKEAEKCFRKASRLQPDNNFYSFGLYQMLVLEMKFKEAAIVKEHADIDNSGVEIAFLEGVRDTATAVRLFNEKKRADPGSLSEGLNTYAFMLEGRKANEKQAFHYAKMAIKADSMNVFPYTTLAELYGLKGDDNNFYLSLEKAVKLGFDMKNIDEGKDEPYKRFAQQGRYKELKMRYSKKH